MLFTHRDSDHDTAAMAQFPTGQFQTPFVFLDNDGLCFLQYHRARWEEPRIRCIPRHEAIRIANLYHMTDLKAALLAQKHAAAEKSLLPASHDHSGRSESTPLETALLNDPANHDLIERLHDLSPDQLEKLSEILGTSGSLS